MAQHGADTVIHDDARLIIFDCYDTLIEREGRVWVQRLGVQALLKHLKRLGRRLVVCSDGPYAEVERDLIEAGVRAEVGTIFGREAACVTLNDGRLFKDLSVVLRAERCKPAQAIFIGDSPMDGQAALAAQVPFIRVPRAEDRQFTFQRLIGGASRYCSVANLEHLQETFTQRKPAPKEP